MRHENIDNALENLFDSLYHKERKGKEYRYQNWLRAIQSDFSSISSHNYDTHGFIIVRIFDNYPNPKTFDVIGHDSKIVELVQNFVKDWIGV